MKHGTGRDGARKTCREYKGSKTYLLIIKLILLTSFKLIARASGVSLPLYVALSFGNGIVIVVVASVVLAVRGSVDVDGSAWNSYS